ncbi:MAG: M48 family metallopeptidase [Patescibacteria group bacterium]|nr:M48 family metallopeptidase [Patescibacteria group bacterium]
MLNVYEQVDRNKTRSNVIVILFAIFVAIVVYFLGRALGYGPDFVGLALIVSGVTSFLGYWYSDQIILTVSGARPATREEDFKFYTAVQNLSLAAGIPMPKLYVIEDSAPNAFATGRDLNHAAIAATTGLLDKLDRTEIEGVVAHEISHIRNYDMRLMSVVAVLVGMIVLLSDWFVRSGMFRGRRKDGEGGQDGLGGIVFLVGLILAILSPLISKLIELALSRRREFLADASGVLLTRQPSGLIRALKKISADREPLEAANRATAPLYIVNPFKGEEGSGWFSNLFSTHPPIELRIQALEQME